MISLILPYWNRPKAAARALASLARHYEGRAVEVVVVDDGSAPAFEKPRHFPLPLTVVRLPAKDGPMSPVTPWNRGVVAARAEMVAISCVEVIHDAPVLFQLAGSVLEGGARTVALAAAWCPEMKEWHCHSTGRSAGAPEMPGASGRPFLAVMRKAFYQATGGFDEAFRDGAGYEDMDWAHRLLAAGARFTIRDDLVVTHPKTDAKISWGAAKFARNRALFEERWGLVPC